MEALFQPACRKNTHGGLRRGPILKKSRALRIRGHGSLRQNGPHARDSAPRKCKAAGVCCERMKFCARAAAGPRAFLFLLCFSHSKIAAQKDARSIHRKPCAALCPVFRLRTQTASNTVAGPRGTFTRFPGGRRRPIGAPAIHKTVSALILLKISGQCKSFFEKLIDWKKKADTPGRARPLRLH